MRPTIFAVLVAQACTTPAEPPRPAPSVQIEAAATAAVSAPSEAPAAQSRRLDPVRPAASYLDDPPEYPDRMARLAFFGPLHASEPDGVTPPLTGERKEAWEGATVVVVEERSDSVRILIDDDLRLVAYALRADLRPVVRRRAGATLGRHSAPVEGDDGVWLLPGTVATKRRVGDLAAVTVDDPIFSGEGWVAHHAVDDVYEPEPDDEPAAKPERFAPLAEGTTITTAAGHPLVTTADATIEVTKLETNGERVRVRYASDTVLAEGWVPAASVGGPRGDLGLIGTGGGSGWGTGGATRFLHAGDRLHAQPEGEVIGRVMGERVLVLDRGPREGGHSVRVHLHGWGFVPVWISGADEDHGDQWEAVYAKRARIEPLKGAAKLPSYLTSRDGAVSRCWTEALAAGAKSPLSLRLTWKSGVEIDVAKAPGMDADLHRCLDRAFDRISVRKPIPTLPLSFMVHLEPLPFPER